MRQRQRGWLRRQTARGFELELRRGSAAEGVAERPADQLVDVGLVAKAHFGLRRVYVDVHRIARHLDEEGIAIVDQHVAHERVLFERITERLTSGRLESQRLLEPMLVDLPPSSRQALVSRAGELERLGFEIEEFGGDTVRVSAFPALLRREECPTALRALAEDLETAGTTATVDEAIKKIAATMACHAAVKANDPLTPEKMAHILNELRQTSYSTICPHGRPVMLRLTRREVEKNFQRI